jgi:AbrB family looped-hinge helix DNA binding protein
VISLGKIGTIGKQSKLTIPSKIRKKYALRRGSKIEFVETNEGIILVPLISLEELKIVAKEHYDSIVNRIETLEKRSKGKNLLKKSKLPEIVTHLELK